MGKTTATAPAPEVAKDQEAAFPDLETKATAGRKEPEISCKAKLKQIQVADASNGTTYRPASRSTSATRRRSSS